MEALKLQDLETRNGSPPTDEDFYLWRLIQRTRDVLTKARQKELNQYNMYARQCAILLTIEAIAENATPGKIAQCVFREPHSIAGLLGRMEKQGLVRKIKAKRNQKIIELTETGRKALQLARKRESVHKIMSCLPGKARQELEAHLKTLLLSALTELATGDQTLFI